MAVFVISDLHLDVKSNEKSMEVFGSRWKSYTDRISNNWNKLVAPTDTVIIPGDISWALTTNEAIYDLLWIEKLPGKKIIMKGNHDFWWSTVSKMKKFFSENGITTIDILNNNALEIENYIIAGSRGWFVDKSVQNTELNVDYEKIINREVIRLKMSLDNAKKLKDETQKEILVFFHFPPVWADYSCEPIVEILKEYDIKRCYFGHIHGCYNVSGRFNYEGIEFNMISADFLDFIPLFIG
jgi:predicted phosphohydrolase